MSIERALITGGGGQLASDLEEQLAGRGVEARAPARTELDITDDAAVARAFELRPDVVFNCAAFHNLDVCEREEDRSFEVNARAVKRLGERCAEAGAKLVHLSTNYVFDGRAPEPYREDDRPNPRSIYAISKLSGEYCALWYGPGALVVRSGGLYGLHGSASKGGNFVTRMLGRAREQGRLKMVADQRLSPTFTADLAAALIEAVDRGAEGIHHLTASGECSWFEFTEAIVAIAGLEVPIERGETNTPPGGVDRPLNGVLARPAADAAGLTPLRHWREALEDYMTRAGLSAEAARA
ncbi:MAG: dTDP-4-dehydrorhamnose reductase [Thermoleophilaceae bacterium]|nr:dTDP-4-dehydrorhamnose reductase [Thermoleophilaceae bacterium]